MTHISSKRNVCKEPGSTRIGPPDRAAFWAFCIRMAGHTRVACARGTLTAHALDKLFVDQQWCCAISRIPFDAPRGKRQPFGPSIDRIVAGGAYDIGNVRLVCNVVNFAMAEWGEDVLHRLVREMSGRIHDEHPKPLKSQDDVLESVN